MSTTTSPQMTTAADLKAKYSGHKTITATAACGHKIYAETGLGVQDRTRDFRADAKTVICTPCEDLAGEIANRPADVPPAKSTAPAATPKQIKFARTLIREHRGEYTSKGQVITLKMLDGISKTDCSTLISDILSLR